MIKIYFRVIRLWLSIMIKISTDADELVNWGTFY